MAFMLHIKFNQMYRNSSSSICMYSPRYLLFLKKLIHSINFTLFVIFTLFLNSFNWYYILHSNLIRTAVIKKNTNWSFNEIFDIYNIESQINTIIFIFQRTEHVLTFFHLCCRTFEMVIIRIVILLTWQLL